MTNEQKVMLIEIIDDWFDSAKNDPEMWCYSYTPDDNGNIEASFIEMLSEDIIDGELFHDDFDDLGKFSNSIEKNKEIKEFIKKYIYEADKISIARKAWSGELDYSEYNTLMEELDNE